MPAVSIVMANFNCAGFIGRAIESVQQQTMRDWEMVIVDDGSTDGSAEIIEEYVRGDSRVRTYRQANAGQATARNAGWAAASAPLVCFLDSDDLWLPGKLEQQLELMRSQPGIDVLYGEEDLIDEQDRPLPQKKMRRYSGSVWRALLRDNFITFSTTMVRRAALTRVGGFDPTIRHADDYDLWLRLSAASEFHYEPRLWGYYRVRARQLSADQSSRLESNRRTVQRFLEAHPGLVTPGLVRATWSWFHTRRAGSMIAVGRRGRAFGAAAQALFWVPWSRQAWRALARVAMSSTRSFKT